MEIITQIFLFATLPGAGGGLAWFFCGVRKGRIKNDKFTRKAIVEMVGGLLVASFIGFPARSLFASSTPVVFISFGIGVSWAAILQVIRIGITEKIGKFINGEDK